VPKDYYLVLGISPDADQRQIKQAYRRAAKRWHPDYPAAGRNPHRFQEASEAYNVLSDASRRRAYDDSQKSGCAADAARRMHRRHTTRSRPYPSRPQAHRYRNASDEGLSAAFSSAHLTLEVIISPREAAKGGRFEVQLPFPHRCGYCRETDAWPRICPVCRGRAHFWATRTFEVEIPPGIPDQTSVQLPLGRYDTAAVILHLRVHVAVSAW